MTRIRTAALAPRSQPLHVAALFIALMAACDCGGSTPQFGAHSQTAGVAQGDSTTITLSVTNPGGLPLTIEFVSPPAHGTVALSGTETSPSVIYTPDSAFTGLDSFTYQANDGKDTTAAVVTVKVLPAVGPVVPGEDAIDDVLANVLVSQGMDTAGGVSLAIAKDGQLVYARGIGYADAPSKTPFAPDALSRIASISKVTTMAATMHLVESGVLGLDDTLLHWLPEYAGYATDPRVASITLRHLLSHSAGWDRDISGDPMFMQGEAAHALGVPSPATCAQVLQWWLGRALDFTPGARHAYSNFGFCVLSLVVEKASGQDLQTYVRDVVLAPQGIHDMRFGASHWADRAPGEVTYATTSTCASVFVGDPGSVPCQYGAYSVPTLAGAAAWIGSAVDLTRFIDGLLGHGKDAYLSQSSLEAVSTVTWPEGSYGLGIETGTNDWGTRWRGHFGQLDRTLTGAFGMDNGWSYAWILNAGNLSSSTSSVPYYDFNLLVYDAIHDAVVHTGFTGSPTDLYPSFPSPELGPYTGT